MKMNVIKTTLAPYWLYIKLGLYALAIGGCVALGFYLDRDEDCGQLDAETAAEIATLRTANAAYEKVERERAEAAVKEDEEFRAEHDKELKAARVRERSLYAKLDAVERELEAARSDPKCAELMELEVCEAITVPLRR